MDWNTCKSGFKNYSNMLEILIYAFLYRFYIKGIRNQATVYAVMEKKNEMFDYVYLVAQTENYPKEKIFVIDNRKQELSFEEF